MSLINWSYGESFLVIAIGTAKGWRSPSSSDSEMLSLFGSLIMLEIHFHTKRILTFIQAQGSRGRFY